jgi:hypothetical protein
MKETKCEAIRRELDELMLGDECSVDATQHLRECGACREFHEKQTRLRQIVGGLGTIQAPPDFDFRLRARLANEPSGAAFHLRALQWPFATRGIAVAAMLVLFVGGVVLLRNAMKQNVVPQQKPSEVAVGQDDPTRPASRPDEVKPAEGVKPDSQTPSVVVASSEVVPRRNRGDRLSRPKPSLASIDRASEGASVMSLSQRQSAIFPIDASLQSLKVSIDDGNGNARTISVPTISFGSQRVLPTGNQFAKKGVW